MAYNGDPVQDVVSLAYLALAAAAAYFIYQFYTKSQAAGVNTSDVGCGTMLALASVPFGLGIYAVDTTMVVPGSAGTTAASLIASGQAAGFSNSDIMDSLVGAFCASASTQDLPTTPAATSGFSLGSLL